MRKTEVIEPGKVRKTQVAAPAVTRDGIIGMLGAIILVASVVLVYALPEEDVILPQFRVEFPDKTSEFPTQSDFIEEGATRDFEYLIPDDNLVGLLIIVGWTDDHPASDPDSFLVEVINPAGESVFRPEKPFTNRPGQPDPAQNNLTQRALPFETQISVSVNPKPATALVEGLEGEAVEDAARRILPQYEAGGSGTWRIRASLLDAGDCRPRAEPGALGCADPNNPSGEDAGNPFSVTKVTYTSYEAVLTAAD